MALGERQMRVVNRRFLLRKRVLIPLGSGIGMLVLAWFVLLPWVVRWRVDAVLDQLKLRDATYRVTRATPWTSTVRDIDAGDGNRIDELRVTYSIEGLWNRRVDSIRVKGLQLTADVREGGATIKALEAMIREAPAASQPAAAAPSEDTAAASARDWPFRSVRVEESQLVIRTPQRSIALPFKATLRWPQLRAEVAGVKIDGAIGDPEAMNVRFSGDGVAGDDLTAVLRTLVPEAPVSIAGQLRIKGNLSRNGEKTAFDAEIVASAPAAESAASDKIAGTNVSVEGGVFHVAGTFSGANRSLKVDAKDVTLAEDSMGAKASGVSADVLFDNQPAATTRPTQVVRVEKLSASKFDLTDGIIRFELGVDGGVNLQEARAKFLGGVVSAGDVRLAPEKP